ncbi:MAG: hypothetical protein KGM44_00355 [bacterium]|nr:hypothetical protein [bacterium]
MALSARSRIRARLDEAAPLKEAAKLLSGGVALRGTPQGARAAVTVSLIKRTKAETAVIVVPEDSRISRRADDLAYFLGVQATRLVELAARPEPDDALFQPKSRERRAAALERMLRDKKSSAIVVTSLAALRQHLAPAAVLRARAMHLKPGSEIAWDALLSSLVAIGYRRVETIKGRGEFAVRGGTLDVWPATEDGARRLEFDGERLERIGLLELPDGRALESLGEIRLWPWSEILDDEETRGELIKRVKEKSAKEYAKAGGDLPDAWAGYAYETTLLDIVGAGALLVLDGEDPPAPEPVLEPVKPAGENVEVVPHVPPLQLGDEELRKVVAEHPFVVVGQSVAKWTPKPKKAIDLGGEELTIETGRTGRVLEQAKAWVERGDELCIVTAKRSRIAGHLRALGLEPKKGSNVYVDRGALGRGFSFATLGMHFICDAELFGEAATAQDVLPSFEGEPITLKELAPGDYVLHAVHGLARYGGVREETILGEKRELIELSFAGNDRLLLPLSAIDVLSRYESRATGVVVELAKMGEAVEQKRSAAKR